MDQRRRRRRRRRRILRGIAINVIIFIMFVCIPSPVLVLASTGGGEGGGQNRYKSGVKEDHQEPNAAERALGLTTRTGGHWAKIKSWLNMALINLRPRDSDKMEKNPSGAGDMVKEVASTSIETSKKTAEKAAQVADDVMRGTADRVKRTLSCSGEQRHHPHSEL